MAKLVIDDITNEQKLQVSDLENKLRVIDRYIHDRKMESSELQLKLYSKISIAIIEQNKIKETLEKVRGITEV